MKNYIIMPFMFQIHLYSLITETHSQNITISNDKSVQESIYPYDRIMSLFNPDEETDSTSDSVLSRCKQLKHSYVI